MKLLRVAASAINQTPLDWKGNLQRIRHVIKEARKQKVHVLCLPELVISGYGCEDAFQMPHVIETSWRCLLELAADSEDMVIAVGLPVLHRGALFNATAVLIDRKVEALIAKRLLAGDGVHYEPRWFKAWPAGIIETIERDNLSVPIGDLFLDVGGIRIGLEICEEAWVANRPGAGLARRGVDIVLNPSASHFAFGKRQIRERFVAEGSRAFQVAYVYSNLLGNESGRIVFDGQGMIASEGHIVGRGQRFSFREWVLTPAVIDIDMNRLSKSRSGSFQPLLGDHDKTFCHEVDFDWQFLHGESPSSPCDSPQEAWENSGYLKEEEFTRAVALGLFDFLRKTKLFGYAISMSGGVDSSAVATLCALALIFARDELGLSGLKERLGFIPGIHSCHELEQIKAMLISTVFQGTHHSSQHTRAAAKSVANALGTTHIEWEIDDIVETYQSLVSQAMKVDLNWRDHDVALQNIQARTRSPGIWLLANIRNQLLLATSNRSEAAVGYATMDGDTSGGLSPLAGIDKAFLRRWTHWMGDHGPAGLKAFPALHEVIKHPPTAELRPASMMQTDEDDLMPYDVLNGIEKAAIRDKKSPAETLETIIPKFLQYDRDKLSFWVKRFFLLWCQNQWKRERYAPGFHLDDESLDPKTWCRFPIISGGFRDELVDL